MDERLLTARVDEFERGLDPAHPEQHDMPTRVLGYGEMSTVLAIEVPPLDGWACKRMALFRSESESSSYETLLADYAEVLRGIGLAVPEQRVATVESPRTGHPVLYLLQRREDPARFANSLAGGLGSDQAGALVRRVLAESAKAWEGGTAGIRVGLDAQLSNWVVDSRPDGEDWDRAGLHYVDTGTPLLRVDGVEQIDAELFIRLCPASLGWIVRRYFLQDVLDRYYDFASVAVDLVANLYKEGRPDLVPDCARAADDVVREVTGAAPGRVTEEVVHSYYREDKLIWRLFLGFRRTERFLSSTLFRRPYDVVLPGRIRR